MRYLAHFLNYFIVQWFGIRITWEADGFDQVQSWGIVLGVLPLSGWGPRGFIGPIRYVALWRY